MEFWKKLFKKTSEDAIDNTPHITLTEKKEDGTIIEKIATENGTITRVISPGIKDGFPQHVKIIETQQTYDLSTVDGINEIEEMLNQTVDIEGYQHQIEYYLQRIATDLKKQQKHDMVLACLRKSNNIMALNTDYYPKKEFLRLPEYLKKMGKFDEARSEENNIEILFPPKNTTKVLAEKSVEVSDNIGSNLIEVSRGSRICAECAKYHDRIYSINGSDSRFPNYDIFNNYLTNKTCSCTLLTWSFSYGLSIMRGLGEKDPVSYSNRPFEDDRTTEEKGAYDEYIDKLETDTKNRKDYDWIRENLPDIAPKSLGGYTKMKNSQSSNFMKIKDAAKNKGYFI